MHKKDEGKHKLPLTVHNPLIQNYSAIVYWKEPIGICKLECLVHYEKRVELFY